MGRTATTKARVRSARPKLQVITAENLSAVKWLVHGFSTRLGGVSEAYGGNALNLGITPEDTRAAVEKNRERFEKAIGVSNRNGSVWPTIPMKQVHSAIVHRVDDASAHGLTGDGLITHRPGLLLTVRTADCIPVLVADRNQRAVGAFHAGWRGTLARIVEKGVGELRKEYGSKPEDMVAAIGPGIHRCCYEVEDEFRDVFAAQFGYANDLFEEVFDSNALHVRYPLLFLNQRAPGHGEPPRKLHLDLIEANRRQLVDAGVPERNIWISDLCTSCRTDLLFSHRAEKGKTGRMLAAIGIRAE